MGAESLRQYKKFVVREGRWRKGAMCGGGGGGKMGFLVETSEVDGLQV